MHKIQKSSKNYQYYTYRFQYKETQFRYHLHTSTNKQTNELLHNPGLYTHSPLRIPFQRG